MPNWVNNTTTITGPKSEIKTLSNKIKETNSVLQHIHPMPKELEGTTSPQDKPNWYDWCIANWGTKWDVVDPDIICEGDDHLVLSFRTAWDPPIEAYEAFIKANSDCAIETEYINETDYESKYQWSSKELEIRK